ncbi:hypothetical protein ACSLNU_20910, partial [Klebsiella variicola]
AERWLQGVEPVVVMALWSGAGNSGNIWRIIICPVNICQGTIFNHYNTCFDVAAVPYPFAGAFVVKNDC